MKTFPTRVALGLGTGAVAIATAALAAPSADAASASALTYWEHGNSRFNMTVSDSTPKVGDVITLSNTFQRKWSDEYIYSVKYTIPSCLDYVAGSARWGSGAVSDVENKSGEETAFVKANAPSITSWRVVGLGAGFGDPFPASMQFRVTAACATGETQPTSLHYGGSLGDGTYKDKGPSITVAKAANPGGGDGGGNGGDGNGGDGNGNGGDGSNNGGGDGGTGGGTGDGAGSSSGFGSLGNLFG